MKAFAWLVAVALLLPATAAARDVSEWPEIRREISASEDVLAASLRDAFGKGKTVHSVEGVYLPNQGVLFNTHISEPWFSIDAQENGTNIHIDADLDLDEIPRMVHDILAELQINVGPYDPESLEELKELRDEQRELRREQRNIRAALRKLRREQVRERDPDKRKDIEDEVAELEIELEAAEAAANALSGDIDAQYQVLENPPKNRGRQKDDAHDLPLIVAGAVCDAAARLRSLKNEHYVTVAVKQRGSMTYITYEMDDVQDCQRRDIDASELVDKSWAYEDS